MKMLLSFQLVNNRRFKTRSEYDDLSHHTALLELKLRLSRLFYKRLFIGAICLLVFCTALKAESIIKFKKIGTCLIVVPINIDGKGPYNFIVDTGSDDTAIDPDLAKELGVKPTGTIMLITIAGSKAVAAGYSLRNVRLGSRMISEIMAVAMDLPALKQYKIRGIAGQNFLSQFNYCIDYKRHEMTIEENCELVDRIIGSAGILGFQKKEGRWMVHVPREAGPALKMVLDTGSIHFLVYNFDELGLAIDKESIQTVQIDTNLGTRAFRAARLRHFKISEIVLRDLNVVLAKNGSGFESHPEDGVIPASQFKAVYFNSAQRKVVLNPIFSRTIQITERSPGIGQAFHNESRD